jgi:hypothetical protein
MPLIFLHGLQKLFLCFGNRLDLRRQDKGKGILPNIPLALDAEGGKPVPGDLRQKRPGHPFDAKGEAGVLDGAFMADGGKVIQKGRNLFLRQPFVQSIDIRRGIAQLRGAGHSLFRLRRISKQLYQHFLFSFQTARGELSKILFLLYQNRPPGATLCFFQKMRN